VSRFRSVVFDVDSTLSAIEGIDWLAALRSPAVAAEVASLTEQAMAGSLPIDQLYGRRLDLVRPTQKELALLGVAYREAVVPGARETVVRFRKEGIAMAIVSGGIREAILPFAKWLGFGGADLHAVSVRHDLAGEYAGWEETSPLATSTGKGVVVKRLALAAPVLGVGDGNTDLAVKEGGATFAAFTGVVRREGVVLQADHIVATFDELSTLVLA
jgi:HAD superfamily phosphoserine phosphatase-like hydrolase